MQYYVNIRSDLNTFDSRVVDLIDMHGDIDGDGDIRSRDALYLQYYVFIRNSLNLFNSSFVDYIEELYCHDG